MTPPVTLNALRYVRLGTANLSAAAEFAERILGLQCVGRTETAAWFRSDHRDHTLVYVAGSAHDQAIAFEVRDEEVLATADGALTAAGFRVTRGDAAACADRRVRAFISVATKAGYAIELVVRPLQSGWRYHGPRDAGITGLEAVAVRGAADGSDEALFTSLLGGKVSDWVGEAAYICFDDAHHRLALHPSAEPGILAVEFAVEGLDQVMQNAYHLRAHQVRIVDGPGRRAASGQLFVTMAGPDGVHFSYVAEGEPATANRRARQFPRRRDSFCQWGSDTTITEYQ